MLSGHVGEGCPFWPCLRDKFSFPAESFRWIGSLLNPGSSTDLLSFCLVPNGADPKFGLLDSRPGRPVFPSFLEKR